MTHKARPTTPQSGALFDELLVVMVQQGDRSALDQLHRRWDDRLVRAAYRFTGDRDSARDLAQECWIGIWRGIGGLRNPSRFRSYAFAILHRRGSDHLRSRISERATSAAADRSNSGVQAPEQGEALALNQAFGALPADQRLAAHLHFVEGLTLAEIAAVQRIPEGTAKSRLFHARRKLKAALNPDTQGEDL